MKLKDRYDGSESPFEGDRTLVWRSLPANALVMKARVKLTPTKSAAGELFEEIITFTNHQGDWGATKNTGTGFVEVDLHKRRTLARVMGTDTVDATLQVDVGGGVYVEINDKGAIKSPNDTLLPVPADGKLPGLTVNKFKLTRAPGSLDVSSVMIRSVPTNVSARLGNLPPFSTHLGELTGEDVSPDFGAVLQAFLPEAKVENGFYQIPLTIHSDTIARLEIALEIEYQIEASVLPEGLNEVLLPYDFGSLPKAQENVLQLAVSPNMRVAPSGVTARVRGAFEETRIVYGPTGAVTPAGTVEISPAMSQAQMISLTETLKATALDLYMVVTQAAKLQLDLREDLDGKPGGVSLLPGPVKFELPAPVGTGQDSRMSGELRWISVVLPAEFQFQKDSKEDPHRSWLVLQCLEGQTAWNAAPAMAGIVGVQHTKDGSLSWRETAAAGISGPASVFFRLRQKPERFKMPVELQVGNGDQAIRVNLDRFQPLGRVDFALDFEAVGQAFNQYLAKVTPAACPETEHLVNGDFEQWLRIGEKLGDPTAIPLQGVRPTVLAISPDGRLAYIGSDDLMQLVDVVCNTVLDETFEISGVPNALVFHPVGRRAYLQGLNRLQVIDTDTHKILGNTLNLKGGAKALALTPDGGVLYVTEYFSDTGSPNNAGFIRAIDTVKLEQAVTKGAPNLEDVIIDKPIDLGSGREPTALAVSPDGSRLYVTIVMRNASNNGEIRIFNTATLQEQSAAIPVGQDPEAIALTPDGKWAVVANAGSHNVSIIDAVRRTVVALPIAVGNNPIAVAISLDGSRAYVANHNDNFVSVIDLALRVVEPFDDVGAPQRAIALTPQGDRIYVITTDGDTDGGNNALVTIQIGTRLPAEWNLTAGQVMPFCLPDPFHLIAVLGESSEKQGQGANPSPSALSLTVPVAESCPYDFSFWGIATEPDAVAEVMWMSKDCGLVRTDQVPIQALEHEAVGVRTNMIIRAVNVAASHPQLVLHRVRLIAPAGAEQAEVRFNVPEGVAAGIDQVSLMATNEAVANADLRVQEEGQLAHWNLMSTALSGVTVVAVEDGIQLRNSSAEITELVQSIPVKGDQPFNLELQGRAITQASAKDNPRIELRWFKADHSAAGSPVILNITPAGLDSVLASGTSPTDASEAELHLVAPPSTVLEIKRVSLNFSTATSVPVTFIAQAPGELTVSNWRVALEQVEAAAPRVPEKGLCTPTPPGRQPGETRSDRCFCSCCESEQTITGTTPMETRSGHPALVGHCATCGTELVRFGGRHVLGAPPVSLRPLAAYQPIVITTRAATAPRERSHAVVPVMTPLTAIPGIGEARARRLAEAGIDSVEKLVSAAPEDVACALRRAGVAAQYATRFIEEAKRLVAQGKGI